MSTYYRVKESVNTRLRKYAGHVGRLDAASDIRPPLRMLDFGHGRKMGFLPAELETVQEMEFDASVKLSTDCAEPGCYAHATSQGMCSRHYGLSLAAARTAALRDG